MKRLALCKEHGHGTAREGIRSGGRGRKGRSAGRRGLRAPSCGREHRTWGGRHKKRSSVSAEAPSSTQSCGYQREQFLAVAGQSRPAATQNNPLSAPQSVASRGHTRRLKQSAKHERRARRVGLIPRRWCSKPERRLRDESTAQPRPQPRASCGQHAHVFAVLCEAARGCEVVSAAHERQHDVPAEQLHLGRQTWSAERLETQLSLGCGIHGSGTLPAAASQSRQRLQQAHQSGCARGLRWASPAAPPPTPRAAFLPILSLAA